MLQPTTILFLLTYCIRRYGCSGYSSGPVFAERPRYSPYQRYSQQPIKHRYHPTTYSKESSEEEMKPAANMPAPQVIPQIQYAYQGGDGFQRPDYQDQNVQVHQGEVLNHVRQQQPSGSPAITPRPHPVYQQMMKPQGGEPAQLETPQRPPQSIPPSVLSSAHNLQEVVYDPHQGFVDDHGYPDHGYPEHHEFEGYHYGFPVLPPPKPPPPPPPPQKSKATESAFAYYYIGRHLWYVPLYFSIYFIAYVGLLVLKSIARHKVLLPHLSEEAAAAAAAANRQIHENYALRSIEEGKQKYYMR